MKKLLSLVLALAMIVSVVTVSMVSASAQAYDTTIKVGDKNYVAKIGDQFSLTVSFDFNKNLSTAQVEVPVDFSILSGEDADYIKTDIAYYSPAAANYAEIFRFDTPNKDHLVGYVMNFASDQGVSYSGGKIALRLNFKVIAAGSVDLTAKVRDVADENDLIVVSRVYAVRDQNFVVTQSANLSTANTYSQGSPRITKFENVNGGIKMAWAGENGAYQYRVFKHNGAKWVTLATTTATNYTDTAVEDGVEYKYTVRCYNSAGKATSDYVADGWVHTYYAPPTITKFENTKTGIKILWKAKDGVSAYRLFAKISGKWKTVGDTDETSYLYTNVASGTAYTFTLRALDARNQLITNYNNTGWTTTYIAEPSVASVANAYGGVKVTINAVKGAVNYRYFRKASTGGWKKVADSTATSYTDKGVASNQDYSYTVRCITKDGKSYVSSYDTVGKKIHYIAAPVINKFENTAKGINLTYGYVDGAAKYRVFIKNGTSWKKLADTELNTYFYATTSSGTKYTFTVRAMDENGKFISNYNTSGWTTTYIGVPKVSKLTNSSSGVKVTITAAKGAVKYRVFRKTGSAGWAKVGDTTTTSYTDKTAKNGTTYYYTVRAISKDGKTYTSAFDKTSKSIKCKR